MSVKTGLGANVGPNMFWAWLGESWREARRERARIIKGLPTREPFVFWHQRLSVASTKMCFGMCIVTSMWGTSTVSAILRSPASELSM